MHRRSDAGRTLDVQLVLRLPWLHWFRGSNPIVVLVIHYRRRVLWWRLWSVFYTGLLFIFVIIFRQLRVQGLRNALRRSGFFRFSKHRDSLMQELCRSLVLRFLLLFFLFSFVVIEGDSEALSNGFCENTVAVHGIHVAVTPANATLRCQRLSRRQRGECETALTCQRLLRWARHLRGVM